MSPQKLNILVYTGPGTTPTSIRHIIFTLRHLLGPRYAITTLTVDQLLSEPWPPTCALLVIPGGADLSYCRSLNGAGNRRIKQYVRTGGSYLGLCAGGYYGSSRCEFEVGRKGWEVVGDRELGFFPGVCRGLAFGGFVYGSESGARAVRVREAVGGGGVFRSYYNGGGVFVDAGRCEADGMGVEVLARYEDELAVEQGDGAAVVFCQVGDGRVVLTGPHPEIEPDVLNPEHYKKDENRSLIDDLKADAKPRADFLRSCLKKLALEVSEEATPVPSLSHLHLSSSVTNAVAELVHSWHEAGVVTKEGGEELIKGENDTFRLQEASKWDLAAMAKAVADVVPQPIRDAVPSAIISSSSQTTTISQTETTNRSTDSSPDRLPDYSTVIKTIATHENSPPDAKTTPNFNHAAFYSNLATFASAHPRNALNSWGQTLLYGEVVTSTNTLLEKNPSLLAHLPNGFVATATTQVAGRGRGNNVWVSPPGSLMFSVVQRHSITLSATAPVVFIQYLAALAIVAGIKNYGKGYSALPIKLKWPNDIYALDPSRPSPPSTSSPQAVQNNRDAYVKIGGILVNSSYAGGDYTLVTGIGLNVNNTLPSTSLSQLATAHNLPPFTLEKLLASIVVEFESIYTSFCRTGFDARLEAQYYGDWLHTDQVVTLEAEGGARARIKGVTRDWGLLVAEEVRGDGVGRGGGGKRWELMSDSNSFDFFKGLVKKKM